MFAFYDDIAFLLMFITLSAVLSNHLTCKRFMKLLEKYQVKKK